jgi:hypothetical protein
LTTSTLAAVSVSPGLILPLVSTSIDSSSSGYTLPRSAPLAIAGHNGASTPAPTPSAAFFISVRRP